MISYQFLIKIWFISFVCCLLLSLNLFSRNQFNKFYCDLNLSSQWRQEDYRSDWLVLQLIKIYRRHQWKWTIKVDGSESAVDCLTQASELSSKLVDLPHSIVDWMKFRKLFFHMARQSKHHKKALQLRFFLKSCLILSLHEYKNVFVLHPKYFPHWLQYCFSFLGRNQSLRHLHNSLKFNIKRR